MRLGRDKLTGDVRIAVFFFNDFELRLCNSKFDVYS